MNEMKIKTNKNVMFLIKNNLKAITPTKYEMSMMPHPSSLEGGKAGTGAARLMCSSQFFLMRLVVEKREKVSSFV